jgi:esterase/lipase
MRAFIYLIIGLLIGVVAIGLFAIWMFRVKPALDMPELRAWHQAGEKELLPNDELAVFSKYLAAESSFIRTAYRNAGSDTAATNNRYDSTSISSPYVIAKVSAAEVSKYGENGNASFSDRPSNGPIRGGVLLVHGLSDSPYHMRAVARIFAEQGFFVIALRLPGHGTIPGALVDVEWQQWYEAVKAGVNMVQNEIGDLNDAQLILGGFSTGGALTLRYVLESASSDKLKTPNKLFLFSPAIAVPSEAKFADWHKTISWISGLEQFRWLEIKPEYDPYKYNSFPKNAGDQIYDLTQANWKLVEKLASDTQKHEMIPPIYAYQSLVDATVIPDRLTDLFAKIGNDKCELMMFDLNRAFTTYVLPEKEALNPLQAINRDQFKATLYIVTNHKKVGTDQFEPQVMESRLSSPIVLPGPQMFSRSRMAAFQSLPEIWFMVQRRYSKLLIPAVKKKSLPLRATTSFAFDIIHSLQ